MQVVDEKDILLSTKSGNVTRQSLSTVKTMGRAGRGTILMRFKNDNDRITSATFLDGGEDVPFTS